MFSLFKKIKIANHKKFLNSVIQYLKILEIVAIISGVIFAGIQLSDVRKNNSSSLMLEFNKELYLPPYSDITAAIYNNSPLFKENGGKFDTVEIDRYLGIYELLSNTYFSRLINDDMLYDGFAYDIIQTYKNKEITNYIKTIRTRDNNSLLFNGFEVMAQDLMKN